MSQPIEPPTPDAARAASAVTIAGGTARPLDATTARAALLVAALARRWHRRRLGFAALAGLGWALPPVALAWRLLDPVATPVARAAAALAIGLLPPIVAAFAARRRRQGPAELAAHLDRTLPSLEESAALVLAPGSLPALQRLQQRRVAVALLAAASDRGGERSTDAEGSLVRLLPQGPRRRALASLFAGAALATLVTVISVPARRITPAARTASGRSARSPAAAPWMRSLAVTVIPPAYTGHRARTTASLAAAAEEGATVRWRVNPAPEVSTATLLFDESEPLALRRQGDGTLEATAIARAPRLVRLVLADARGTVWRSPPARLEVVADRPPTLELLAPATNLVERPLERPGALTIEVALADDHGPTAAELVVTLAAGSDEQVTFREGRLPLPLRRGPARQVSKRTLDLVALGFAKETELYVRVEASDGRRPDPQGPPQPNVSRTNTVIVRPAGVRLESAELGAGLPMIAGPEIFRSQRQVVIDTQALIAAAPRLTAGEVMRRSRAIGFDQRALRMRYGNLLGQEFEEGRAVDPEEERRAAATGGDDADADQVPDDLQHHHDSTESATFFTEPVRRKLRAMLAGMWDAEGALAVGQPRTALPHELRALALLKEVQQADRVFVRKSAGDGAPLDPARRLTGELDEVHDLAEREPPPPPRPVTEAALLTLDAISASTQERRGGATGVDAGPLAILRPALAARAREGSASALAALPALDDLAAGAPLPPAARDALERALWELVPPPQAPPGASAPEGPLWRGYRERLGGGG